ncbi:DUF2563 family protein [Nocardia colli]|uniref:DUF2563 family protein n=1 Tax=Nocardia colli TaxID=2545717 RepID=UPI0035DECB3C
MYADLDRVMRGSDHAGAAADHVHGAGEQLRAAEVTVDMFGRTEAAANAAAVLSRAHAQHATALDDHHRDLTWISEQTAVAATTLDQADRAGADNVRRVHVADRRT